MNGTLTATTNASGQATFSGLSDNTAGTYTLTAKSKSGSVSTLSSPFTITAAAATTLSFVTQPNSTMAGAILNAVNVLAKDKFGNFVSRNDGRL